MILSQLKVLIIINAIFLYSNCSKYPENKYSKVLPTKTLILQYEWQINKILINNVDLTQAYNDSLIDSDFTDYNFDFFHIDDEKNKEDFLLKLISSKNVPFENFSSLAEKRTKLLIKEDWVGGSLNGTLNEIKNLKLLNRLIKPGEYEIRKLYKKDLKIRLTLNARQTDIEFKKFK